MYHPQECVTGKSNLMTDYNLFCDVTHANPMCVRCLEVLEERAQCKPKRRLE